MTMSPDEMRAKTARLRALRLKASEVKHIDVTPEIVAEVEALVHVAEVREKAKVPLPSRVEAEEEFLRRLIEGIRDNLRPVDADGVQPPVLYEGWRSLRIEAHREQRNGQVGPKYPALIGLRIEALRFVQYQYKLGRQVAAVKIAEMGGASAHAMKSSFYSYAHDAEMEDNPYGYQRYTAREVLEGLAKRKLGIVWDYLADDVINTERTYTITCEAGLGHPSWNKTFTKIWHQAGRCPECVKLRRFRTPRKRA